MSKLVFNEDLGGTTTLQAQNTAANFVLNVPADDGTLVHTDTSGTATFDNLSLTGAVVAGAWDADTIDVAHGGTGAVTLTGYVKGTGTTAMTANATIPNTDITGLGTMSTQNASSVAITGGAISGISPPIPVASGGSGAATLTGYVIGNGTSAMTASATIPNTDITGLGTMSTQSADAVAITGGTANGLTIGASNPVAVTATTLRVNSTVSLAGNTGTAGQVLTSNGGSAPTWESVAGVGTVTSVDGSGGTTGLSLSGGPITASGTLTLGGTLAAASGGTGQASYTTGDLLYASGSESISKLGVGTTGQILTVSGGVPSWQAAPATGVESFSAGTTGFTPSTATTGAVTLGGTLAVANGGTNGTAAPTAGTVAYGTGTAYAFTSAGTSGQVLQSNGSDAPTWVTPAGGVTLANDTSTATNLYPTFAGATTGSVSTIYTGDARLLYKPSTGELQSSALVASNGIVVNSATVSADYTIPSGSNAMSAGPVTVADGITVTVPSGSTWVVV
jgi:hypothetical protein